MSDPRIDAQIELRKSVRVTGPITASLRTRAAKSLSIAVADLSATGFRASWPNRLEKGDLIWVRLPGSGPLEAVVVWSDLRTLGCEFKTPLHAAVFDAIRSAQQ